MRDRLIDLVRESQQICFREKDCKECSGYGKGAECLYFQIADYLLENGVIVPPCKVGDTVYFVAGDEVMFSLVEKIKIEQAAMFNPEMVFNSIYLVGVFNPIPFDLIGKTVFLTREEAEAALKGGEG